MTHIASRACHQRGCRLPECEREDYLYTKQLKLEHSRGEYRLRDAAPVRAHIETLMANNWWPAEIARTAGISSSDIRNILDGQQQVSKRIAEPILAVPVIRLLRNDRGDRVDATGSTRRLQALAWLGHPYGDISELADVTSDRLRFIGSGNTNIVRPEEARKIAAAYRALSVKPGRLKQIATVARTKGWHGPAAWDDIDNPDEQPDVESAVALELNRDELAAIRRAEIAHLIAFNLSYAEIATRLGMNPDYVRDIARSIRNDLEKAA